MKKLNDLKQEKSNLVTEMNNIIARSNDGLSDDDKTKWNDLDEKVQRMNSDIVMLEKQEDYNKTLIQRQGNYSQNELKDFSKFDLFKAIRESIDGGTVTGLEKELHDDQVNNIRRSNINYSPSGYVVNPVLMKRDATTVTGSDWKKVNQAPLSIIQTPMVSDLLGVSKLSGLNGVMEMPWHNEQEAAFVDELTAHTQASFSPQKYTLSPVGVGLSLPFSKEYLASVDPSVHSEFLQSFVLPIEISKDKRLFGVVSALTANQLTGYSAIEYGLFTDLEAEIEGVGSYGHVMNKQLVSTARRTPKYVVSGQTAAAGGMIYENGTIDGTTAIGTDILKGNNLILSGIWNYAVIGDWGSYEIIADYVTQARQRVLNITVTQLADAKVKNPNAFAWASL